MTTSFAIVDESSLQTLDSADRIEHVRRRPVTDEVPASFFPDGLYRVETINGPIRVEAPVWILWDPNGFPYPVAPEVFDKSYLRRGRNGEYEDDTEQRDKQEHRQRMQGMDARSYDREQMLAKLGGQILNDSKLIRQNPPSMDSGTLVVPVTDWIALALALNDMAKVRWMLERRSQDADKLWDDACQLLGIDPDTLEREVEIVPGEQETPPPKNLAAPKLRNMPNTEHTVKPDELMVVVDDPELSHSYVYAIQTDDIELARALAIQQAHAEDPSGKDSLDTAQIEVYARYARVQGEERMP